MATHSSFLAWRIPWTEKPDRLQSMGLQKSGAVQAEYNSAGTFGSDSKANDPNLRPYCFSEQILYQRPWRTC